MTIVMFGGKRVRFASRRHHPNCEARGWQHHVVGVLCCRRDWCTSQNRWHHEEENDVDILKQHLKTSVRKLMLGLKWVFQMDNDPKYTSKVVAKCLKDNKVNILEWPSQSTNFNPRENVWAELKKRVRARRTTNLTPLHQLRQEEWAKLQPNYCGKLVEGYPKCLNQVKQFKMQCYHCPLGMWWNK